MVQVSNIFSDPRELLLNIQRVERPHAVRNVDSRCRSRPWSRGRGAERELAEARDQQTATSEILRVIGRSQTNVQPVFDTILSSAVRLLRGYSGTVTLIEGDQIELAALTSIDDAGDASLRALFPQSLNSETAHGWAIRERAPINIADAQTDSGTPEAVRASARARGYRSWLTVPLLRHDEAVGTISVTRREPGGFSDEEISLLMTFADQAVIAIENTRLFEAEQASKRGLQESLKYQTATSEVLNVISRSPAHLQPVFETIAIKALELCDGKTSGVYTFDGEFIHLATTHSLSDEAAARLRQTYPLRPNRGGAVARAILTRATVYIPNVLQDPEYELQDLSKTMGYLSILSVPMLQNGKPIGAINITSTVVGAFSEKQISLLQTFADQAVIAIENTRLFEAEQASKRELTESLEYQTATSEVLNVISRSPSQLQPVVDAIVQTAKRLCSAERATLWCWRGGKIRSARAHDHRSSACKVSEG